MLKLRYFAFTRVTKKTRDWQLDPNFLHSAEDQWVSILSKILRQNLRFQALGIFVHFGLELPTILEI